MRASVKAILSAICAAAAALGQAAPIGVSAVQELGFGKFVAAGGGAVSVAPGGARTAAGAVQLLPSGAWSAARFMVTGDPDQSYSISLPADGSVLLLSGANSMALNAFASDPDGAGQLGGGGAQTLSIGATLGVGPGQASGNYSGAFGVTVNYN